MKSYIVAAIFLTVISIMITVYCQTDEDEEGMTYFELGRKYDDDSTSYTQIGKRTDLSQLFNNEIELRYVALNTPVTFMKIKVNAIVKTFQFAYLNQSACVIRLYGLRSPDRFVTAVATIHSPDGAVNETTGKFEFNVVNKTMLLEKVVEGKPGPQ
ncbi:uncharacterized protein LOC119077305 [Bradysia coprophila]|uniref:uncharacterized protein LOC119077305 n=1 Tax=Bradysia coprophila TaxID=38358 RepID=UPI00187DB524|nr:uncharacterized protein LOC119077305 [Bradysia coprophila]